MHPLPYMSTYESHSYVGSSDLRLNCNVPYQPQRRQQPLSNILRSVPMPRLQLALRSSQLPMRQVLSLDMSDCLCSHVAIEALVSFQHRAQSSRVGLMAVHAVQAQQAAPANGAPGPVVHMRQWLAARISEPARRMLDFHMDTYSMVNCQTPLLSPSSRVLQRATIHVKRK